MSLSKCIGKTYTAPELHTELRGLARRYAKTMGTEAAEKRAAAELLEATMDDLETVRDHLIAKGFPLDVKEPARGKQEFKFVAADDPRFMVAYHGSPYNFDKFSLKHVGSGEGAQAFGYGLYFAESKEVAEWYRKALSKRNSWLKLPADDAVAEVRSRVEKAREGLLAQKAASKSGQWVVERVNGHQEVYKTEAEARAAMKSGAGDVMYAEESGGFSYADEEKVRAANQALEVLGAKDSFQLNRLAGPRETPPAALKRLGEMLGFNTDDLINENTAGQTYEVDIPDDQHLMLWDKPLSEQPEAVKEALAGAGVIQKMMAKWESGDKRTPPPFLTGQEIYRYLEDSFPQKRGNVGGIDASLPNDRAASEYLRSIGIPGHKYLDGTSRSAGEGSYNYVIYDDQAVQIERKKFGPGGEVRFSLTPTEQAHQDIALGKKVVFDPITASEVGLRDIVDQMVKQHGKRTQVGKDMGAWQTVFMQSQQVANRHPEAREMLRVQEMAEEARQEGFHKVMDAPARLLKALQKNAKLYTQLAQVIHQLDGEELSGVTEGKFTSEKDEQGIHRYELNDKHYEQMASVLTKHGVDQKVVDAYIAIRRSLDTSLILTMEKMQELKVDANLIDKMRSSIGRLQNYFPHMRFGDHYINVADENGQTIYNEHVQAGAMGMRSPSFMRRVAAIRKAYPGKEVTYDKMRNLPEGVFEKGIDSANLLQVITAAVDRMEDAPAEMKDLMRKEISKQVSQVLLARGWGQHAMKRKGIPGYEMQDIGRVLNAYHSGHQGWLAKIDKAHRFTAVLNTIDSRKQEHLYRWAKNFASSMLRNQEDWDRRSATLRTLLSIWYIGGRVSSAVMNLTQNLILGMPRMYVEGGLMGTLKSYLPNAFRTMAYLYADRTGNEEAKAKHMKPGELAFLKEFHDKGITEANFMRNVAGLDEGITDNILAKTAQILFYPFMAAERFNRVSMALAAYRMARDGKIDNEKTLAKYGREKGDRFSEIDARDFARDMVIDAHFLPGKANLPGLMRSDNAALRGASTAAYTFLGYSHGLLGAWRRMLTMQGWRGKAAFAASILTLAKLGGIGAIPMMGTLLAAGRAASGDDWDRDMQRWFRDLMGDNGADVAMYGVGAMMPEGWKFTMQPSMAMNLPIFTDMKENRPAGEQLVMGLVEAIGGVPVAALEQAIRAGTFAMNGNAYRAVETAAPAFLASAMRAHRLSDEGATDSKGRPQAAPGQKAAFKLEGGEVALQAAGFTPLSKQKMQDANQSVQRMEEHRQAVQSRLVARYVQAKKRGDSEAVQEILDERSAFNQKMREGGHAGLVIKEPLAKLAKDHMAIKKTPKRMGVETRDAAASWGIQ